MRHYAYKHYSGTHHVDASASRFWRASLPEWDLASAGERRMLVGEAKWSATPFDRPELERLARGIAQKPLPPMPAFDGTREVVRALFVPDVVKGTPRRLAGVQIVTAAELLRS